MSKLRRPKKAQARLRERQAAWDSHDVQTKRATRRPGSTNPHKGRGGQGKTKKGRRR